MPGTRSGPCTLFLLLAAIASGDALAPMPPVTAAADAPAGRDMPCLRESAVGATAGSIISADAVSPTEASGGVDEARSLEAPGHAPQSLHALRMIGVCTEHRPVMPVSADREMRVRPLRRLSA